MSMPEKPPPAYPSALDTHFLGFDKFKCISAKLFSIVQGAILKSHLTNGSLEDITFDYNAKTQLKESFHILTGVDTKYSGWGEVFRVLHAYVTQKTTLEVANVLSAEFVSSLSQPLQKFAYHRAFQRYLEVFPNILSNNEEVIELAKNNLASDILAITAAFLTLPAGIEVKEHTMAVGPSLLEMIKTGVMFSMKKGSTQESAEIVLNTLAGIIPAVGHFTLGAFHRQLVALMNQKFRDTYVCMKVMNIGVYLQQYVDLENNFCNVVANCKAEKIETYAQVLKNTELLKKGTGLDSYKQKTTGNQAIMYPVTSNFAANPLLQPQIGSLGSINPLVQQQAATVAALQQQNALAQQQAMSSPLLYQNALAQQQAMANPLLGGQNLLGNSMGGGLLGNGLGTNGVLGGNLLTNQSLLGNTIGGGMLGATVNPQIAALAQQNALMQQNQLGLNSALLPQNQMGFNPALFNPGLAGGFLNQKL